MAEEVYYWQNETIDELECFYLYLNDTLQRIGEICNTTWDHLSCWPPTPRGTLAVLPCLESIRGIHYDTTQNVTRLCREDGTWAPKSDYSHCQPVIPVDVELQDLWDMKEATTLYYVGYGISLVFLIIALWIFLYIKELHCLRNTIHTNLMLTFTLFDLTWILAATLQSYPVGESHKAYCILVIFLTYFLTTNFFWMFVEGLYLYILVVKTFSLEYIKFYVYAFIGWGIPAVVVTTWATVKSFYTNTSDDSFAKQGCLWQSKDNYDFIFTCPVIVILLINIFFLGEIMWVLITKLRATSSVESKQYRKAAKALLVLIPLLGITYVVVIVTPEHRTAIIVFGYLEAVLLSTQGFTVAVLYCFLSTEVRMSLRHHLERWKTRRSLSGLANHRNSLEYRQAIPVPEEALSTDSCIAPENVLRLSDNEERVTLKDLRSNGGSHYVSVPTLSDDGDL